MTIWLPVQRLPVEPRCPGNVAQFPSPRTTAGPVTAQFPRPWGAGSAPRSCACVGWARRGGGHDASPSSDAGWRRRTGSLRRRPARPPRPARPSRGRAAAPPGPGGIGVGPTLYVPQGFAGGGAPPRDLLSEARGPRPGAATTCLGAWPCAVGRVGRQLRPAGRARLAGAPLRRARREDRGNPRGARLGIPGVLLAPRSASVGFGRAVYLGRPNGHVGLADRGAGPTKLERYLGGRGIRPPNTPDPRTIPGAWPSDEQAGRGRAVDGRRCLVRAA